MPTPNRPSDFSHPSVHKRRRWLFAGVVILALAIAAWRVEHLLSQQEPPLGPQAASSGAAQSVAVAAAVLGDMPITLSGLGTATSLATVTVQSQISGYLTSVAFREGQIVHRGDLLAQIDPRLYEAAVKQYEGQLRRDQALLDNARRDLVRYQRLNAQDSTSRQTLDTALATVRQYEGTVESDQGELDTQRTNLAYCRIVSPIDGRVGLRQVDAGNYITPSLTNGLVVVAQVSPISVVFTLPEDDVPQIMRRLQPGASLPVVARDRADQNDIARGKLDTIDNQIDTTTGTVKLRALFDNADGALFPNQFVSAHLLIDTEHNAILAPAAAIQQGSSGTFVYQVKDGSVVVQPVTTGATDGTRVVVHSGLAEGDTVVIDGADRLRNGAKVRVAPADGKQADSKP